MAPFEKEIGKLVTGAGTDFKKNPEADFKDFHETRREEARRGIRFLRPEQFRGYWVSYLAFKFFRALSSLTRIAVSVRLYSLARSLISRPV